jgi:DNA modification methylase
MNYRLEPYEFIQGDCIEVMKKEKFSPHLIITDPPYNINWKYSDKVNDNKEDYHRWCLEWAELCMKQLDDRGVLCIINYPENNNILFTNLVEKGYNFVQQLIWTYPTNIGQSKKKYTRSYRTILVFSKSKEYYFNPLKGEYKNPNDKRIKERIINGHAPNHYDVFEFNLCKNVSKSKNKNGINQLPKELVNMLIDTYSDYHDVVMDPFVGNGTVMNCAWDKWRGGIGIDINDYCEVRKR